MSSALISNLYNLTYNIMPYGSAFFGGCFVAMYTYIEVDLSFEGIEWARFSKLVGATLMLMSVLPLTSLVVLG